MACTEVGILVDDDVEELEYFDIVLQNDSLVLAVAPDTATIFISKRQCVCRDHCVCPSLNNVLT